MPDPFTGLSPGMSRRSFGLALAGGVVVGLAPRSGRANAPVADTEYGRVGGVLEEGIRVFKGIPYGADTGGANRWLPARPPAPWTGVRDAHQYPPAAMQATSERVPVVSEDCLGLNVWTPALADGGKRPVMVWLHGGGFSSLSGSSPMYDGLAVHWFL